MSAYAANPNPRRILGLVPARAGSKGVPGKNVRPLCGRPLIAWTLDAALASGVLDEVAVSTDDATAAQCAREAGARVIDRPAELAGDSAAMIDVVRHALTVAGPDVTHVMLLQPTSPLRLADDVRAAVARLEESGGRAVVSVCEAEHSPLLASTLPGDGSMASFLSVQHATANRQELGAYFRLNGAIYLAEVDYLLGVGAFIGPETFALVMPQERSVDIDTETDFAVAECLMSRRAV